MSGTRRALILLLASAGCKSDGATCALGPAPRTTPIAGDINGDGALDLADGTFVLDHLFRGGAAPPCAQAADVVPDGVLDAGDGYAVWYHLLTGRSAIPALGEACAPPGEGAEDAAPTCADGLALSIDGTRDGDVVHATVRLSSPVAVEGLSLGVRATGCTITGVTTADTQAADLHDDPPGKRDGGLFRADLVGGHAVVAVVMAIAGDAALPAGDGVPVLSVTASGGGGCTLDLVGDLAGAGEVVPVMAAIGGRSYHPAVSGVTVP